MTELPAPEPEPLPVRGSRDVPSDWEEVTPIPVPLRAGGETELPLVRLMLTELRILQQQDRDQFATLAALSHGGTPALSVSRDLIQDGFLVELDGSLKPLTRAVLASALLDTPEGVVLREAVDLSDENVRAAYREQEGRAARNLGRLLRRTSGGAGK